MNKETLNRANKIAEEIKELKQFVEWYIPKRNIIQIIKNPKQNSKMLFRIHNKITYHSEIDISDELAARVLSTMNDYIKDLEKELEEI